MKIELSISIPTFIIITTAIQAVYNTKAHTRRTKSTLSIALDVTAKLDAKLSSFKKNEITLFDQKKKIKLSFKFHEADMLELLLIDQIRYADDPYIKQQIQKVIDMLNQKLA